MKPHIIYRNKDRNFAPDSIKDGNGDIVLAMCRVCGKAEKELDEPCIELSAFEKAMDAENDYIHNLNRP